MDLVKFVYLSGAVSLVLGVLAVLRVDVFLIRKATAAASRFRRIPFVVKMIALGVLGAAVLIVSLMSWVMSDGPKAAVVPPVTPTATPSKIVAPDRYDHMLIVVASPNSGGASIPDVETRLEKMGVPKRIGAAWGWLLFTPRTVKDVSDNLNLYHDGDKLFVTEISGTNQGWMPKENWEWLNERTR